MMKPQAFLPAQGFRRVGWVCLYCLFACLLYAEVTSGQSAPSSQSKPAGNVASATAQEKPSPLIPGNSVQREVARGQEQSYLIAMTTGQFLHVVVEQQSVDVTVAIAGSDGKAIAEIGLT